jgi:hypothetical protein
MQELEARRELRRVGTELVQQAAADLAARGGGGGNQRPSVVDPGSFLALILRTVGRGASGLALDHAWASNQAATFILAGAVGGVGCRRWGLLDVPPRLAIPAKPACLVHAGYETTGNAIAFAVYLIAANPGAQQGGRPLCCFCAAGLPNTSCTESAPPPPASHTVCRGGGAAAG